MIEGDFHLIMGCTSSTPSRDEWLATVQQFSGKFVWKSVRRSTREATKSDLFVQIDSIDTKRKCAWFSGFGTSKFRNRYYACQIFGKIQGFHVEIRKEIFLSVEEGMCPPSHYRCRLPSISSDLANILVCSNESVQGVLRRCVL